MTKQKMEASLDLLLENAKVYLTDPNDLTLLKETYQYAKEKHAGQFRKSGEAYIQHPLSVALILTEVYADLPTLQAALLHDVLEDCDVVESEITERFGKEVESLVYGVTKLGRINFSTENEYLVEYYKKIIVGMSEDVRVIIIKLADRLHNMRTLWALPIEKQKRIAKETIEILAPIAHHLGIYKIKSELEDLSLRYLKPEVFYDIAEKLNNTKLERDHTVAQMEKEVSDLLTEHHIAHEIKGRSKSIYSIYNKLNKGRKFSDIYDLLALRIFVRTEQECYLAIGIIHSKFRPVPKRFKDYIAMPKVNGYQSLHTTVFGVDGETFEIQIRTYEMDEVAENGVASHWAYKERKDANATAALQSSTEQKLQFFKAIIELSKDKMSSEEFVNSVKDEVLNNNIYVFTPKGDIIELPKGATPIDFAYKIHTKVGETLVGAIVNNSIVPLSYQLKNNDIVKINTNKNSRPSKEWLNLVKSTQARNKLRAYFSKSEKEDYITKGKEQLESALRKRKIPFQDFFQEANEAKLLDVFKVDTLEELYQTIGSGKNPANAVINAIEKEEVLPALKPKAIFKNSNADVIVAGIDKVKVSLASCCNPIPGDKIIGYITKGNGITIHRTICHNLEYANERTVSVTWNELAGKKYVTTIVIYSNVSTNKIADLVQQISRLDASVERIVMTNKKEPCSYEVDLLIKDTSQLDKVFLMLERLSYVESVERLIK